MNIDYLTRHPEINGGVGKVVKEVTRVEVDAETGETYRVIEEEEQVVGKEPDFIKLYTDCICLFNNMDLALSPYIVAFGRHMTYANHPNPMYQCVIRTDQMVREDVALRIGVTDAMVKKMVKQLVDAEVFIPMVVNGKKRRGIYFVNPWVIGKGEWKDIKALRGQFEFVTGQASFVSIDNNDQTRKIAIPITERKYEQISLPEMQEGDA